MLHLCCDDKLVVGVLAHAKIKLKMNDIGVYFYHPILHYLQG